MWQKMSVKLKGKTCKASIGVCVIDMVNNEKPRKETGCERDEDAAIDASSHEERYNHKRTCERISKKQHYGNYS